MVKYLCENEERAFETWRRVEEEARSMCGREKDSLRHILQICKRDKRGCKKREEILREDGGEFRYIKELQMEKTKRMGDK